MHLLQCRQTLYPLSHLGSPIYFTGIHSIYEGWMNTFPNHCKTELSKTIFSKLCMFVGEFLNININVFKHLTFQRLINGYVLFIIYYIWLYIYICVCIYIYTHTHTGFPGGSVVKNLPANAGGSRDVGSTPVSGRSP